MPAVQEHDARSEDDEAIVVRGHALDRQQASVVRDESFTQLVVAGAGTGKTTTLIGKVKHLVEHDRVEPRRILMISLTNNSVADLKKAVKSEFGEDFQTPDDDIRIKVLDALHQPVFLPACRYTAEDMVLNPDLIDGRALSDQILQHQIIRIAVSAHADVFGIAVIDDQRFVAKVFPCHFPHADSRVSFMREHGAGSPPMR